MLAFSDTSKDAKINLVTQKKNNSLSSIPRLSLQEASLDHPQYNNSAKVRSLLTLLQKRVTETMYKIKIETVNGRTDREHVLVKASVLYVVRRDFLLPFDLDGNVQTNRTRDR